jgi:hypothetical protein
VSKILIFEGAGWDQAEHNGVGNCRIRATFLNRFGTTIYLELTGHKPHAHSPKFVSKYLFYGHVSHCLSGGCRGERMNVEGMGLEYTKERILGLVNSIEIGGNFTDIEVNNTNWCGFTLDGKPEVSS